MSDDVGEGEPPAIHKLVHPTEILENVLLQLDTRTLLHCQRVCKTFKETIDGSVYLQEALLFRQAPTTRATAYGDGGVNPLLTDDWQRRLARSTLCDTRAEPAAFYAYLYHRPTGKTVKLGSWRKMAFVHGVPSPKNKLDSKILKCFKGRAIRKEGYDLEWEEGSDECVRVGGGPLRWVRFRLRSGEFFWERTGEGLVVRQE